MMKGIILAGGSGTRLFPITIATCKQLLPVYDKPMIYYPLSTLMLAGIKDVLIITKKEDIKRFKSLFGNGNQLGMHISYAIQEQPDGLAQALIIAESFIGDSPSALILGDNIFYGSGFTQDLKKSVELAKNGYASVFGYYVENPSNFGVVEFNSKFEVISIEEKPVHPKSNYCVTGLYFYPPGVSNLAKSLKKSSRNEYEITDLNNLYLKDNKLVVNILGRGFSWMDAGTHSSLVDASSYIKDIENHQALKIACIEEIAYASRWITRSKLIQIGQSMKNNEYGQYLLKVAKNRIVYPKLK